MISILTKIIVIMIFPIIEQPYVRVLLLLGHIPFITIHHEVCFPPYTPSDCLLDRPRCSHTERSHNTPAAGSSSVRSRASWLPTWQLPVIGKPWRFSQMEEPQHELQALVGLAQRQVGVGAQPAQGVH